MNELTVTINKTELLIKEYRGQRVVTMKEIDAVHQRPEGTASRNFNSNRKHFIEGVDFFQLSYEEARSTNIVEQPNSQGLTLITESGYLMLVKSFTDDLAWAVQRQLVNTYFRATPEQRQRTTQADPSKKAIAEAKLNNSRARMAAEWRKIASIVSVPEYKDICASHASAALAGREVLPLPERTEHYYTATEIGELLGGIDKARIGRLANQNGLKTEQYGRMVWDKSPHSAKQVQSFVYNSQAVERFRELLGQ